MIAFHNDHLVSPEFCKLIYDLVPERMHVPVRFNAHTEEYKVNGRCFWDHIELNLQGIYYHGRSKDRNPDFAVWKHLLWVTLHEFGHIATYNAVMPSINAAYDIDYKAHGIIETLANRWADAAMAYLADFDKRLAQPEKLGGYFDGRLAKDRARMRKWTSSNPKALTSWRCKQSGGQLTITEVAAFCGEYTFTWRQDGFSMVRYVNTRLIRALAGDLAYHYTDRAGRELLFFAWGDLEEIKRRVMVYRLDCPKKVSPPEPQGLVSGSDDDIPF